MIRKHAVRLQKLTSRNIGSEPCQNISRIKAARAVAGVNNYLISFKRLLSLGFPYPVTYKLSEARGILGHIIDRFYNAAFIR